MRSAAYLHLDILGFLLTGEAESPSDGGGGEYLNAPDNGTSANLARSGGGVISLVTIITVVSLVLLDFVGSWQKRFEEEAEPDMLARRAICCD